MFYEESSELPKIAKNCQNSPKLPKYTNYKWDYVDHHLVTLCTFICELSLARLLYLDNASNGETKSLASVELRKVIDNDSSLM